VNPDIASQARRRTLHLAALIAVAVLMVIGTVLVALTARHAPAPPVPAASTGAATTAAPSIAPTPSTLDTNLTWTTVAGARVPVSAIAGPSATTGDRARGFGHSALGAVLAAAHISVRLCPQVGPAVFGPTLREQVVGDSAAALGERLAGDYERARAGLDLPHGEPAGRLYSTARGYQVALDSPTTATVRLLIEGPGQDGTVLVALTLRTRWTSGDWRLVAPRGGLWDDDTALVTDTTGFTRFPPGG
jgi:hypothetical protein